MRARMFVAGSVAVLSAFSPVVMAAPAEAASLSTWKRLAQCESGQRWQINTGNGYYGGLQFSARTWKGFGGRKFAFNAHRATRAEQIKIAEKVRRNQGWGAWPTCSRKLGLR